MEGNTNNNSDLSLEELNRLRENTANAHYYSTQQDLTRLGNIDAQITQLESSQAAPTPTVIPSVQITSQPGQMTPEEVITYMRQNPDMVPAGFQNNESYYNMVYDNMNNDPMTLANYNQRIQRDFIGPMPATNDIANSINNTSSTSPYDPNFNATPTPYSRNDNASTDNSTSNTTNISSTSSYDPNFNSTPSTYSRNDNTTSNSFNSVIESSHSRTNYYNTIRCDNYGNYLTRPQTWGIQNHAHQSVVDPFPAEDCSYTKVKVHEIANEIKRTEIELIRDINAIIDKLETAKESSKNAISIMGEPFGTNKIEMLIEVLRELPDDIVNRLENFALAPAVERCNEYQEDANDDAWHKADAKRDELRAAEAAENALKKIFTGTTSYSVVEV